MGGHYGCKRTRYFSNLVSKDKKIGQLADHMPAARVDQPLAARDFNDIPGPSGIFGIGTFYQYFPLIGKCIQVSTHSRRTASFSRMIILFLKLQEPIASTKCTNRASLNTTSTATSWKSAFCRASTLCGCSIQTTLPRCWTTPAQTCIRSGKAIWPWRNIAKIGRICIKPVAYCRRECKHGPIRCWNL